MNQAQRFFFALCIAWAGIGMFIFLVSLNAYLEDGNSILASVGLVGGFICPPQSLVSFMWLRDRFVRT